MLVCKKFNQVGDRSDYDGQFVEIEVEGAKELDILCPVSKLTGNRMSLQQVVFMITDSNERLANVLLQEIPSITSDDRVSDDDKLAMLVSRLESGSFFENDNVAQIMGNIVKQFFPDADVDKVVKEAETKINFESSDAPSTDA